MMKKILTLIMAVVLCLGAFVGCTSDPVSDEFEKFINTDMVEPNKLYEDFKAELQTWEKYTTNEELINSVENVILPNFKSAKEKVEAIKLTTKEIKAIRGKYNAVLDTYIEAYELTLTGLKNNDTKPVEDGNNKLEEGLKLLEKYNKALEDLAKEKGLSIEY